MAAFRSARERRWWVAVALAVALLLAALYPLQFVLDALRAANLLRLTIGGLFFSCALAAAVAFARRRVRLRTWLVLALSTALYGALALVMEVPQERLHLVEYGALALLVRAAFAESLAVRGPGRRVTQAGVWALGLVALIGWLDELVQGALPNRHYDLRDVGWNALAAALALVAAAAVRATMKSEERANR